MMSRKVSDTSRQRRAVKWYFQVWLAGHVHTLTSTLIEFMITPVTTLMTVTAIGLALSLPTVLYIITENLQILGGRWDQSAAISLFLASDIDEQQAAQLAQRWSTDRRIAKARVVSREEGLAEFRAYSGLGAALDQLTSNPLPVVIVIDPSSFVIDHEALQRLTTSLEDTKDVDFARLDIEWARRLEALLALLQQASWLLATALAFGVLLAIGNTVRLEIEQRRDEIEVMYLVGATAGFIRRPFLYIGLWYGLFGGFVAWLLVVVAILVLQQPIDYLAAQYHTKFEIMGLQSAAIWLLIGGAGLLGMIGSWLAVARHLTRLDLAIRLP
jgi:cell division transport system permease protein